MYKGKYHPKHAKDHSYRVEDRNTCGCHNYDRLKFSVTRMILKLNSRYMAITVPNVSKTACIIIEGTASPNAFW